MGEPRRVDLEAVKHVLMEHEGHIGTFERAIGFRPATTAYKGVHLMNDLAQCVLGGVPSHRGDFLARAIRPHIEGEGNDEPTLRAHPKFGAAFDRAFPADLGRDRIEAIRLAAREVFSLDGGIYEPGTSMCSPLATHKDLLGAEGFRRFGVGRLLADVLPDEGRAKLKAHFESCGDPLTRAFRPLLLEATFESKQKPQTQFDRNAFDQHLGRALTTLMEQPLAKPTMLRTVAIGGFLGLVLKIFGAAFDGGRPVLLALANTDERGAKPLREEAVVALRKCQERFERRVAEMIPDHPLAPEILKKPGARATCVEVPDARTLAALAPSVVAAARAAKSDDIYWPDRFAVSIGRKAGCILPLTDRAGWGKHLALTPELVEVLVLMHVPSGERPPTWRELWRRVREGFGIVVGANVTEDIAFLSAAGVESVSDEGLADNAEALLTHAVRRGVARRLPDGEAEVGGDLS